MIEGKITRISGPVVDADGMTGATLYEVARVGNEQLIGEIIRIVGDIATIQVYEPTDGLKPGEPVIATGKPLTVQLGPGILEQIYDGIQRPLPVIQAQRGAFIERGIEVPGIDHEKKWDMKIKVKVGDKVKPGDIIAVTQETPAIEHRIMIPPDMPAGTVKKAVSDGEYTVDEVLVVVETKDGATYEVKGYHEWPVRRPRPFKKRLGSEIPLLTGQRIFDTFFPIAKGGTAGIPGPFGTGKTVSQHQLARWGDAQIVVYVGCGERGNEMTQVLEEFPHLDDPHTGLKLMTRTALIANTSNMPVAAREASVYTGITLAEYYRDMGYDVSIQADSTSRWAEAMREISGRLEEMPGEEGYPAYLASRIAEYYERSGRVVCIGSDDRVGSVTVVGAVSPPGGDFSEPVTQNTLRIVKVFWALTKTLAAKRHFPAISYLDSYTLYWEQLESFYRERFGKDFPELRAEAFRVLQQDNELQEIVQLVGPDALPPSERIVLEAGRIIKEDFLQQNAFHEADSYCSPEKQYLMLKAIILFYGKMREMYEQGVDIKAMIDHDIVEEIARMKYVRNEEAGKALKDLIDRITALKPEDFVIAAETN